MPTSFEIAQAIEPLFVRQRHHNASIWADGESHWGDEGLILIYPSEEFARSEFWLVTEHVPHREDAESVDGYLYTGDSVRTTAHLYLKDFLIGATITQKNLQAWDWGENDELNPAAQHGRVVELLSTLASQIEVPDYEGEDE